MCGRFASQLPPELIRRLFATIGDVPNLPPNWNVGPTQFAMVIRRHRETGERRLDALRWGLVPSFTKDLKACKRPINARSETAATSGMFRGALQARRCLVPCDAFYAFVGRSMLDYHVCEVDWLEDARGRQTSPRQKPTLKSTKPQGIWQLSPSASLKPRMERGLSGA